MTGKTENSPPKKSLAQLDYEEGLRYLEKGEIGPAALALHNAMVGFEESGEEKGIANAADKLADICTERGELANALRHLERAAAICAKSGDELSSTYIKKKIARAHWRLRDYSKAMDLYLELLDAYRDFNNPAGAAWVFEELGGMCHEMGEPAKAADALRTAASIHKGFKHARQAAILEEKAREIESTQN